MDDSQLIPPSSPIVFTTPPPGTRLHSSRLPYPLEAMLIAPPIPDERSSKQTRSLGDATETARRVWIG
jgi:hypothetical protein